MSAEFFAPTQVLTAVLDFPCGTSSAGNELYRRKRAWLVIDDDQRACIVTYPPPWSVGSPRACLSCEPGRIALAWFRSGCEVGPRPVCRHVAAVEAAEDVERAQQTPERRPGEWQVDPEMFT